MKTGEDAVAALLGILNREGVPYMIVGSFSSNRYGVPRATHDADFVAVMQVQGPARLDWSYIEEWGLFKGFHISP